MLGFGHPSRVHSLMSNPCLRFSTYPKATPSISTCQQNFLAVCPSKLSSPCSNQGFHIGIEKYFHSHSTAGFFYYSNAQRLQPIHDHTPLLFPSLPFEDGALRTLGFKKESGPLTTYGAKVARASDCPYTRTLEERKNVSGVRGE